jgi:hypothetical protein
MATEIKPFNVGFYPSLLAIGQKIRLVGPQLRRDAHPIKFIVFYTAEYSERAEVTYIDEYVLEITVPNITGATTVYAQNSIEELTQIGNALIHA